MGGHYNHTKNKGYHRITLKIIYIYIYNTEGKRNLASKNHFLVYYFQILLQRGKSNVGDAPAMPLRLNAFFPLQMHRFGVLRASSQQCHARVPKRTKVRFSLPNKGCMASDTLQLLKVHIVLFFYFFSSLFGSRENCIALKFLLTFVLFVWKDCQLPVNRENPRQ